MSRLKRKQKVDRKSFKNSVISVFSSNPKKNYNYKQIAKALLVKKNDEKKLIIDLLNELRGEGLIEELIPGKFKLKSAVGYIIGKIDITSAGYGFVTTDSLEDDVFIAKSNLNKALHGDMVKVYLYAHRKSRKFEGEVVEILERARETFVGIVEILDKYAFFEPDSKQMPYDLFIPLEKLNGAKNGQKVVAKITDWPSKVKNPYGEVVEVLGNQGEHETEIHAILAEFELPYKFLKEVEEEAEKIPLEISQEEYAGRKDFRGTTTFTIDPDDAKDFDDALSIKKLDNGNWEIGVHIADVSHYVKPKTILDDEALERATSVYLVDRVVPMLPEHLSNYICSLRPDEEKLCFSAVFELTEGARIISEWFGKTIIKSDRRFTYAEAQNIINTGEGDFAAEVLKLNELAIELRDNRFSNGAISFERDEVKFDLDEKGKPIRVYFREHGLSNELVEEFMLLANKRVAEFIGNKPNKSERKTFVYRIHDKPNPEKLQKFNRVLNKFGHKLLLSSDNAISNTLNKVLTDVKGKPEQDLVETLAVRSMAKAVYSCGNIGHYGLAFPYYTHFTSPIRRYPDIMVHRMLFDYLNGGESKSKTKYEKLCKHSSDQEQLATEAERASIKFKQVEFMQDKIGKVFDGLISGVSEYGIFVEIIENKCEGLVSIRELMDDFYEYDDDNYWLMGRHSGKIYQLGDKVKVEVLRANLQKKQLDYIFVEEENPEK
ncbi:MAG: ribonuclease R [Bacteroidales bacterium]|nr:ribonuclease R [Bacteroidales bacterium]MBN2820617.1 ribonuclease R [Bacteroidales bacterium]